LCRMKALAAAFLSKSIIEILNGVERNCLQRPPCEPRIGEQEACKDAASCSQALAPPSKHSNVRNGSKADARLMSALGGQQT